ncbi:MAG: Photosynthesis system assembly factor [Frankiaceae bacterium]|jgi:photosystem II stability/assembly factor-like uncharacterized protein|nr:Photosynthesis system assembly factor [Frankiaceae bacterium]
MSRHRIVRGAAALAVLAAGLVGTAGHATTGPASAWVPTLPLAQSSRQQLSAFRDGTAYVFDEGSSITLWHSANHGLSWDPLTYLPAGLSGFARTRFASPKVGYLTDLDRVFTTTDGASTAIGWRQLAGPKLAKGDSYEAYELGVNGSTVAFGGVTDGPLHAGCNPPKHGDIWTSHDSGRTWVDARLPADAYVGSVRYVGARDGVAWAWDVHPDGTPCEYLGDSASVWVTHDGGRHFTRVLRCAHKPGEICTAAVFLDSRHLLVGRNDGTMTASSDGGRTFHEQAGLPTILGPQPTKSDNDEDFWIQGFAVADQVLFATTKFAGAYISGNGGASWIRETSCDTPYGLGIGDVAAFDGVRAIAGGPNCIATRTDGTTNGAGVPVPPPAVRRPTGPDVVATAAGLRQSISNGVLTVSRLRPAASPAG